MKDDGSPIQLLMGADVAGKLLTGEIILENGVVAINTYLGWTLMETVSNFKSCSLTMIVSTLFSSQMPVSSLWELDYVVLVIQSYKGKRKSECLLSRTLTKRKIISAEHKLFDPIGFTAPVVLIPKLLIQQLWKYDLNWDAPVPGAVEKSFRKWDKSLHRLNKIAIYRVESFLGTEVHLVEANAKVVPFKKTTTPSLELLAATIATRLASKISYHLGIDMSDIYIWSDSANIITWMQREEN
ncbi:hypothetical protein PR048_022665 [Dryococelus australis]|uniref:RNase H type-1 domain-containing protein n=1 Tax=Dryococelus australis TaxID=614101 RepID=A0ABQ9H1R0_9NEOP|nr:hypothetical protein PR048_022665 [Dryococelus australis]